MNVWPLNKISNEEKANILSQHRHVYNGYRAVNPTISNEQPLYVQDFANDKEGMVINNKGVAKKYTNFAINESEDKELCTECGGQMYEGECTECGNEMYEDDCMECGEEAFEGIHDVGDLKKGNKFDYVQEGDDEIIYELELDSKYFEENESDDYDFEPMESAFADEEGEVDEMWGAVGRAALAGAGAELGNRAVNYVSDKFESVDPELKHDYESEEPLDELAPLVGMAARAGGAYLAGKAIDSFSNEDELEEEIDDDLKESFKVEKARIMEMMNRMKVLK